MRPASIVLAMVLSAVLLAPSPARAIDDPEGYRELSVAGKVLVSTGFVTYTAGALTYPWYIIDRFYHCDGSGAEDGCEPPPCHHDPMCTAGLTLSATGLASMLVGVPLLFAARQAALSQLASLPAKRKAYIRRLSAASWVFYGLTIVAASLYFPPLWSEITGLAAVFPAALISISLMGHSLRVTHKHLEHKVEATSERKIYPVPYVAPVQGGAVAGVAAVF